MPGSSPYVSHWRPATRHCLVCLAALSNLCRPGKALGHAGICTQGFSICGLSPAQAACAPSPVNTKYFHDALSTEFRPLKLNYTT